MSTLDIQVTTEKVEDNSLKATVTVAAADIDKAVAATYADISKRYSFQGFRKGRVPRPVIDAMIGRDAVLAEATNTVINQLEPVLCERLNVVPLTDINYGDDLAPAKAGEDYVVEASIAVRPECTLASYDAPAIDMPPAEPTDAEIDEQIEVLQSYRTTYDDIEEDRAATKDDIVSIDIENMENAEGFAGENRMLDLSGNGMPDVFNESIEGLKKDESCEIAWTDSHTHGEEVHEVERKVKVTLKAIKVKNVPELTEDYVKENYGFNSIEELRDAVRKEIETDKAYSLPNIKENRCVAALAEKLDLDEIPELYLNSVYSELVQEFLQQLQRQGTTIDAYLQARGISINQFTADAREQAEERARQSLALDALARHLEFTITEDELKEQFAESRPNDADAAMKEFADAGRLPALREAMLRTKALAWLVENAQVTEVDEAAQRLAEKSEQKTASSGKKKATKAASKKKTTKATATKAADKKAADKKKTTKATGEKKATKSRAKKATKTEDAAE